MTVDVTVTPPAAPDTDSTRDRGTTTVADRVIVAVAARAAAEVPGIVPASRAGRLPVGVRRPGRAPQVEATVAENTVTLRMRVSVAYPGPVRTVTEEVRRHVADRVGVLTGMTVGRVDLTVASLPLPVASARVI